MFLHGNSKRQDPAQCTARSSVSRELPEGVAALAESYRTATWGEHHDAAVGLGRQDVHQGVAVLVERHRGVGLQQLPVDGAQDADIVVGPWGGARSTTTVSPPHLQSRARTLTHTHNLEM